MCHVRDLELGEHVGIAGCHWGLQHHDEVFRFSRCELSDNRSLQGAVDRIFDGPALEAEL